MGARRRVARCGEGNREKRHETGARLRRKERSREMAREEGGDWRRRGVERMGK